MSYLEDIKHCDIFYPNNEEFKNFEMYVEKIDKKCKTGIMKIVPPKTYKPRKDKYKNLNLYVPHPIEQNVNGYNGIYELLLLTKEGRTSEKYFKQSKDFDKITDGKKPIDIEKLFWKTLKFSPPVYGADSLGSIFDKNIPWNLSEIISTLHKGLNYQTLGGITTPYLYFGCWKSMFAWHKEDMDLNSINFNHFGKSKHWYGIPPEDRFKFDNLVLKLYPDANRKCSEFMRHKTYMIHPEILIQNNIKVFKCVQNAGEFVITKAAAYHAGFNSGTNLAEAVNFSLSDWLKIAKNCKRCECISNTVKIDFVSFENNLKNVLINEKTKNNNNNKITKNTKSNYSTKSNNTSLNSFSTKDIEICIEDNSINKSNNKLNKSNKHNEQNKDKKNNIINKDSSLYKKCIKCKKLRKTSSGYTNSIKNKNKFECKNLIGYSCTTRENKCKSNTNPLTKLSKRNKTKSINYKKKSKILLLTNNNNKNNKCKKQLQKTKNKSKSKSKEVHIFIKSNIRTRRSMKLGV